MNIIFLLRSKAEYRSISTARLPWYDSDIFDGEIEDMVISEFIEADEKPKSAEMYYGFLLKKNCEK